MARSQGGFTFSVTSVDGFVAFSQIDLVSSENRRGGEKKYKDPQGAQSVWREVWKEQKTLLQPQFIFSLAIPVSVVQQYLDKTV